MPTVTVPQAFTLALQHHQAGRLGDAEALYRQVLAVQPNHAEALHFLGVIAHQTGQHALAIDLIRQAIVLAPNNPVAPSNLGEAYRMMGRIDEAITSFRRALELKADSPEAHYNLGNALRDKRLFDEAVAAYRRALQLKPGDPEAQNNLGLVLSEQGRLDEAVAAYRHALQLKPNYAEAHSNLGNALKIRGQLDEALAAHQRALQLKPDCPEFHNNLGNALKDRGQLDEALAAYRRALELKPHRAEFHSNLGNAFKNRGQLAEAIAAYRRALESKPDYPEAHSNLIYTLHLHPGESPAAISEEQQRWNRQFSEPVKRFLQAHTNDRSPERRLRIGYVSPDFRFHAVSFFLAPLLEAHDRRLYEIYCYASVPRSDAVTDRLRKSADIWRDVRSFSDAQLADLVRNDGIDILVDLAMHTAGNRLPAFARRPAPVQISWLAYPGSTGMEAIDYRLTDAHIDPPGSEDSGLGGQAVRLPDSWCCYDPIQKFPDVGPLPAARQGSVTFGSLNQFGKIHEGLLHCWARLMEAVPGSRLLMVCPHGEVRERIRTLFNEHGIAEARLELVAHCPWLDYIRLFERIDVALDPYPCNGMTTTCHALWMGVPVVTLAGTSAVSRAGSSLLHAVGLPEWVAQSEEEYIRIATKWATDLSRMAELRTTLRSRMQASPLMDAPRFARNVETAYRSMWRRWCAQKQS